METIEARWFFRDPPEQLTQLRGASEARTDLYAPIASPHSSVKLRERRLEAKFFTGDAGDTGDGWQRWSKVSVALPNLNEAMHRCVESAWLPVGKERTIHAFTVDQESHVKPAARFDGEVQVEWCRVTLPETVAWTLCVEVVESSGVQAGKSVLNYLRDELGFDLSHFPPPQAYPAWLLETAVRQA